MCPHHALAFLARAHEEPKRRAFWKIRSAELSNHGQLRSFPREHGTTPPILEQLQAMSRKEREGVDLAELRWVIWVP